MIIIWSNILVYTLVQKLLLPRLTLATECYYIFNTRIFGIQDCFTSSPHYKNHSDSGFVSHVIRLHISTSSCLLSRCVFRPALGCSSYTDILSRYTYISYHDTRSGYVQYVQGNQPNVPARTTCRHGLYNSMVRARTSTCTYQTDQNRPRYVHVPY